MKHKRSKAQTPPEDWYQQLPLAVAQVIEANRSPDTDPLGSYTGVPADDPCEAPVQDADDL